MKYGRIPCVRPNGSGKDEIEVMQFEKRRIGIVFSGTPQRHRKRFARRATPCHSSADAGNSDRIVRLRHGHFLPNRLAR